MLVGSVSVLLCSALAPGGHNMPKYGRADHNLVQRFQAHWFWRDDQISVCKGFQSFKTGD
jgi:hypothetical protein